MQKILTSKFVIEEVWFIKDQVALILTTPAVAATATTTLAATAITISITINAATENIWMLQNYRPINLKDTHWHEHIIHYYYVI